MDEIEKDIKNIHNKVKGVVHIILFHSYSSYLGAIVFGILIDQFIKMDLFDYEAFGYFGWFMIIIGTSLIFWAQTSTRVKKEEWKNDRDVNFFFHGPYRYTRNPTNLGMFIMCLGLGFLMNSPFSIILIILVYLLSRFVFIRKQDLILSDRYGDAFKEYKKKVKNWL